MANPRALDKRRKSVRNIRKITRTMELIATARFKKAMDRATSASAYTDRITKLVADLAHSGTQVSHPLMQPRERVDGAILLVLTANRGLCGGYNGNIVRQALTRWAALREEIEHTQLEVSGKRGISAIRYRQIRPEVEFTHFEDRPRYEEVEVIASRYLDEYTAGQIDRVDVAYMKFHSVARQYPRDRDAPATGIADRRRRRGREHRRRRPRGRPSYEFLPSADAILEEIVPASFKVRLFKCFLDAAVSEQIARMVAMKSATENAGDLIQQLSRTYNRARQTKITNEIMEVIGGVEALSK